jgi:phytoene dehydrogenase-like protein
VRVSAPIVRVHVKGGRVAGVELEGGERIPASTVIADVMPHALLRLADFSGAYRSLLGRYRYGASTLKVDWALDGPVPWTNEEVRKAGTIHVGEPAGGAAPLPERPFLLAGQQSLADPSRAPEGKHTAWAYTHGPSGGDVDWTGHVDRMEAQIERFAPGFRDLILARHVMGPAELEARNRNLVGGDVGGGSYALRQVVFRPIPKLSPYTTPVRGLFLGSAATFPGGAVHGVPGDAAARSALRR